MEASDLWQQFMLKLQVAGTSLHDIEGCSASVLQSVLAELGFSALQSAKLQTEWQRRCGGAASGHVSPAGAAASASLLRQGVAEDSAEYVEVTTAAGDFLQNAGAVVLGVERVTNAVLDNEQREMRRDMCNGKTVAVRKGRLVAADSVDRVAADGLFHDAAADRVCESGYVLLSEVEDRALGAIASGGAQAMKLVLYDVVAGNVKLMVEGVAANLAQFSTEQVRRSLRDEGFDSVQVQRAQAYESDAFVVFHARQAVPRYVVSFAFPAAGASPARSGASPHSALRASAGIMCAAHPAKPVEFWCVEEKKLVCSHCMFVDGYQQKACVMLDAGAAQEAAWLGTWVGSAEQFAGDITRVMSSFDAAMEGLEADALGELAAVRANVAEVKAQLDDFYQRISAEVERATQEQTSALQRSLMQVVALQSGVEDVVASSRAALASGSAIDVLSCREAAGKHWPAIDIPAYHAPQCAVDIGAMCATLRGPADLRLVPGTVDLPELIDVNHLSRPAPQEL
jgi:hypothetical protein